MTQFKKGNANRHTSQNQPQLGKPFLQTGKEHSQKPIGLSMPIDITKLFD
ncbi:hypothetical protein [Dethiosulfatarculus sandiegensis]|nr:hypothetical protein [Dethiosulfatarculus sandiegensis]